MRSDHFKELLLRTKPEQEYYIHVLETNPFDENEPKIAYNALLVAAEQAKEAIEDQETTGTIITDVTPSIRTRDEILYLASQPIAAIDTGCGISEGYGIGGYYGGEGYMSSFMPLNPYSVFDYGVASLRKESDDHGPLEFNCHECNGLNRRPYGGWVYDCIRCGADVSCGRRQKEEEARKAAEHQKTLEAARKIEEDTRERAEMMRKAKSRKNKVKEKEHARRH
jgi:hypothetical protein